MVILSESSTCLDLMLQYCSKVQRSGLICRYKYLSLLFLQNVSLLFSHNSLCFLGTYYSQNYAGIIYQGLLSTHIRGGTLVIISVRDMRLLTMQE